MPWARIAVMASVAAVVLWVFLDSGLGDTQPAPPVTSLALLVLSGFFGLGAWVMRLAGREERAPLLAGLAIGVSGYAVLRLTLPG